ncbi:MAG: hypothetical protein A2103_03550 [Gammaproteobacteria bacterium GWF2_41_13]|nr:MAG: hypothetical protein A2103_03550 [Gammaproteobacteria bacterium GWF2_41_13]
MNVKLKNLSIKGVLTVVPKNKLVLQTLSDKFGFNEIKRIMMSTGIESVGIALPDQKASDFCLYAAQHLMEQLSILSKSVDAIIFVSQTPDYKMPATSCVLQGKLKLPKTVLAFDINYGCSGYIYGLYQASLLVNSGSCERVLVCVGDTISHHLSPDDQKTRLVFGDGGAATIVERGEHDIAFNIMTDGTGFQHLMVDKTKEGSDADLCMNGSEIMEFALREVPLSIDAVLSQMDWRKEDVGIFALHQANQFMLDYLRKKLNLKREQVPIAVKCYGNTGSASIPLVLCHHCKDFTAESRAKVILSGFGAGLSWGSVATNLSQTTIMDVMEI